MLDTKQGHKVMRYYDNTGGANLNISDILQRNAEMVECINIDTTKLGSLKRKNGDLQYGQTVIADRSFSGGFSWKDSLGVTHNLVTCNSLNLNNTSLIEISSGVQTLKYDLSDANKEYDFVSILGYLFITCENADDLLTTNNLTTFGKTNAWGAPTGKFIEEFNNEPYISGVYGYPEKVYKGTLQNPGVGAVCYVSGDQSGALTSITVDSTKYLYAGMDIDIYQRYTDIHRSNCWKRRITAITSKTTFTIQTALSITLQDSDEVYLTYTKQDYPGYAVINRPSILWNQAEDNFDLPPNGQSIVGMRKSNNRLVIWKDNSVYRWDGATLAEVSPVIGLSSPKSIVTLGTKTIWLYKGMFYSYDGALPTPISQKIQPVLSSMTDYTKCVGIPDEEKGVARFFLGDISCKELTGENVWAVYHLDKDQWDFETGVHATVAFSDPTGINSTTMFVGDNTGLVYTLNSDTDSPVPFSAKTKYDCQQAPEVIKEYTAITVVSRIPGGKVAYATDFSDEYKEIGDLDSIINYFELTDVKGTFFSLKWYGSDAGETPEFLGFSLFYKDLGAGDGI